MTKDNKFVLEVELTEKPYTGFSYARARKAFTDKLLSFMTKEGEQEKELFSEILNFEITEEGSLEISLKVNPRLGYNFLTSKKGEDAKTRIALDLETHLGLGLGDESDNQRLNDLFEQGIIPISYIKKFERQEE